MMVLLYHHKKICLSTRLEYTEKGERMELFRRTGGCLEEYFFFPPIVYYREIKREVNRGLVYEYRCDERLRTTVVGSTHLEYTGLCGGLEHQKKWTMLIYG
jgi:hypothetical protein